MWYATLIVLMQAATAGVPFWALLWAIDRLRGGDGTRIDSEALESAWREHFGADAGPEAVPETSVGAGRVMVEPAKSHGTLRVGRRSFAVQRFSMQLHEPLDRWGPPTHIEGTVVIGIPMGAAWRALEHAMQGGVPVDLMLGMGPAGASFAALIRSLDCELPSMQCEVEFTSHGPILADGVLP